MTSRNLTASKYAPRTPAENVAISRAERLKQDKDKATRLLHRLKWKAQSLEASYTRAIRIQNSEVEPNGYVDGRGEACYPFVFGMSSKQAESMFKVDFFEFYTLLERYLVLCLSICGVSVSGAAPRTNVNALRFITNTDYARGRTEASHQFHANLLDALDDNKNPLHAVFGIQDIRIQLGLAKDYRNRWKDADEELVSSKREWASGEKPVKLNELNLALMVPAILEGCERALSIVHGRTDPCVQNGTAFEIAPNGYGSLETMETDDTPLEYMDDAMDLD